MREAMAAAEVGDEQSFADPTVNALCERVAELLGFEAAVFLPSGTMCNAIAFRLHVGPGGDEAYLHRRSHPIVAEAGGPAAISGAVLCPLDGERGMFTADALRSGPAARGRPLPAALAARVAWSRRRTSRAGTCGRGSSSTRSSAVAREAGPAAAHGRRAADERGGGERALGRLVGRRVRHGVGGLLQGARARRSARAWRARGS